MNCTSFAASRPAAATLALVSLLAQIGTASETPTKPAERPVPNVEIASYVAIPQSRVFSSEPGDGPLRVEKRAVDVTLVDADAKTNVEVTLANTSAAVATADVLVPVPRRAHAASVEVEGADAQPAFKAYRGKSARALWAAVAARFKTLEPLEFSDCDAIKVSSVAVPAHGARSVTVDYESKLTQVGDRVDYSLPRSPAASGEALTPKVHVVASRPVAAVFSSTNLVDTSPAGTDELDVSVGADRGVAGGPFRLSVLFGGGQPAATFFTYPDSGSDGGYFVMLGALPPRHGERAPAPREITVVLDRSGSMNGEKLDQARRAILKALRRLRDGEAFNVVDFASERRSLFEAPVAKNAETLARAEQYLGRITAVGGTNIDDPLVAALRVRPIEGTQPIVMLVTDGEPTAGETNEEAIRANARAANQFNRRVYTVGLGYDVNAPLLDALASEAGGRCTFVASGQDVEATLDEAFDRLGGAALANARVESTAPGAISEVVPANLGDLRDGEQFMVAGRYHGVGAIPVRLLGEEGDAPAAYDFTLDATQGSDRDSFVARVWASRRVADLARSVVAAGARHGSAAEAPRAGIEPAAAADEIVDLALAYGVVTEYTGFLTAPGTNLADRARLVLDVTRALAAQAGEARHGAAAVNRIVALRRAQGAASTGGESAARALYVGDLALVRRDGSWVDTRVLELGPGIKPDTTVAVGSTELAALRDQLVERHRAGVFALSGALVQVNGKVYRLGPTAMR